MVPQPRDQQVTSRVGADRLTANSYGGTHDMALAPIIETEATVSPLGHGDGAPPANASQLQWYVFGLFFIFGGITSLNDVLIPKLKHLFSLNYFEAMLIQFAFFTAYALISMPGAALVKRFGYMRTAVIGLLTMAAGCLLFIPASTSSLYVAFLGALFVLASGVVIVQVVANPLISMLGQKRTTHSRLTFAQAFNSLGTTIFPLVGATLILGSLAMVDPATLQGAERDAFLEAETQAIVRTYLGLAAAAVHALWQLKSLNPADAQNCLTIFRANRSFGLLILAGLLLDGLL